MCFIKRDLFSKSYNNTNRNNGNKVQRNCASKMRPPYPEMLELTFPIWSGRSCLLTFTAVKDIYFFKYLFEKVACVLMGEDYQNFSPFSVRGKEQEKNNNNNKNLFRLYKDLALINVKWNNIKQIKIPPVQVSKVYRRII